MGPAELVWYFKTFFCGENIPYGIQDANQWKLHKAAKELAFFFSFFLELENLSFPYAYTDDPVLSSDR